MSFINKGKKTTNTSVTNDNRTVAEGESIAVGGANNTITMLDGGAIESSFSLAEKSIGAVETSSGDAVSGILAASNNALNKVVQSAQSETNQIVSKVGMWSVLGIVAFIVAKRFS